MNQTIADALFLSRAMGAPVPPGKDWAKWTSAALLNPERRAAGMAHIEALLGQLPTPEDAARAPVEPEPPKSPLDAIVYSSTNHILGEWIPRRGAPRYQGLCPCESGHDFGICHGVDSIADEARSAQDRQS